MRRALSSLVLVLLLSSFAKGSSYTSYVHAQEWGGSICTENSCSASTSGAATRTTWNIHGLWPDGGTQNEFCTNQAFNWGSFSSTLQGQLEQFWSGLYSTESDFLSHEWTKHGTCWNWTLGDLSEMPSTIQAILKGTSSSNSQSQFFELVLMIHAHYDTYSALSSQGITPSDTKAYMSSDIVAALDKAFGPKNYILQCVSGSPKNTGFLIEKAEGLGSSSLLLNQVEICLDLNYKPMACPGGAYNSCSSTASIWYPTFK